MVIKKIFRGEKMNDIEITSDKNIINKVKIDGKDISKYVSQAFLMMSSGELPKLELTLIGPIKVKTKGNVVTFKEE